MFKASEKDPVIKNIAIVSIYANWVELNTYISHLPAFFKKLEEKNLNPVLEHWDGTIDSLEGDSRQVVIYMSDQMTRGLMKVKPEELQEFCKKNGHYLIEKKRVVYSPDK